MHTMTEEHHFNGKVHPIEIKFTETLDVDGNFEIIRITGGEGQATMNYVAEHITNHYGRKQTQQRMFEWVRNPKSKSKKD